MTVLSIFMVSTLKEVINIIEYFANKSIPFRKNLSYISLLFSPKYSQFDISVEQKCVFAEMTIWQLPFPHWPSGKYKKILERYYEL